MGSARSERWSKHGNVPASGRCDGFTEMYKTLDIHFDRFYFPSAEEQPGKQVVDELIQRGIAIDERPEGRGNRPDR